MNSSSPQILIIDYEEDVLIDLERLLEDEGFRTSTCWSEFDAIKALSKGSFDLVLVNEYMPNVNIEHFICRLHDLVGDVPCVVMRRKSTMSDSTRLPTGTVDAVCKSSGREVVEAAHYWYQTRKNKVSA